MGYFVKIMAVFRRIVGFPFVILVKVYQWIISPLIPQSCRYTPTCSNYMIEAINVWGPFKGLYLGTKRIISCHPWGGHGHDPVPKRETKN
ncbi:MAG: putative membrane protein insertion efficiency factor [Crocinitomicaceae bacterium]|jgi:putative membrane protein insertion efficiency factor